MALYIVSEGDGERDALPALVFRVSSHHGLRLPAHAPRHGWKKPLLSRVQVVSVCEQMRALSDCDALLLTRDADCDDRPDQDCPRCSAPELADWVRALDLPFPTAVVLFYKEYETLFLAGAAAMGGRAVKDKRGSVVARIRAEAEAHPDPEKPRDAKSWVKNTLVPAYKPTLHQALLTRMLDPDDKDLNALSSYRRLVSALRFLSSEQGTAGRVYPPDPDHAIRPSPC